MASYNTFLSTPPPFSVQGLNDLDAAVEHYREVLKVDSTNVEAIACIGTHHFYNDQPEIALRFYRSNPEDTYIALLSLSLSHLLVDSV